MAKLHRDNAGYIGCSHEETQDPYYSYNKLSLPLSGATETVQRPAEVTHTVTVAGGKFVIGGVSQATLSLVEGGTYKFDQSDSSNSTHPFKFSQTSDGTHNRGTEYTKGVTYVGTPGSSGAYTQLVVPFGGLDLYYYCGNHSDMGGSASTPANAGMFTAALPILKTTDQFGKTLGSGTNADPFAANLVLALPMNGSNNGTTFTDQSAAIKGSGSAKAITRNNAVTSTAQSIFYGSSAVFDGTDDYLSIAASSDFDFGSGDFTIEFWWYRTSNARQALYHRSSGTDHSLGIDFASQGQTLGIWASSNGTSWDMLNADAGGNGIGTITPALNAWSHIAYTRSGGVFRLYINGILDISVANSSSIVDETNLSPNIGAWWNTSSMGEVTGYLCDFRIYKGVAKYKPEGSGSLGMDVLTYTGNGSTQTISGLNFQPDFVWIKSRSTAYGHRIFDRVRGLDGLYPNETDQEDTNAVNENFVSYDSNGFTVGTTSGINALNNSNVTMVAWCWKAGGAAVSNTDGTITSQVSANRTHGFSIVSYSNTSDGSTIGHSLSSNPYFMLIKNRSSTSDWMVWFNGFANNELLNLNNTDGKSTSGSNTFIKGVSSTTFTVGSSSIVNGSDDYIAYVWSEVAGFSKFGSYTGSGSSGNTITTGFKPRFVLVKRTTNISGSHMGWSIVDSERGSTQKLQAQSSAAENDGPINAASPTDDVTFNDDGFTLASGGGASNASGETYIYAAFAESAPGDPGQDAFKILETLNTKDQSSSAHTVTNNGASFQTSIKKFYDGAAEFGTNKFLTLGSSEDFNFGSGDFTIEYWLYRTSLGSNDATVGNYTQQSSGYFICLHSNSTDAYLALNGSTLMSGGTAEANKWIHYAFVRSGTACTIYKDGSPVAAATSSAQAGATNAMNIGAYSDGSSAITGHMQDVRIYKGIAKYTSSFSPPERSVQGTARRYPSGIYVVS